MTEVGAGMSEAEDAAKETLDAGAATAARELSPFIPATCRTVTVDVFDTLLLRRPISERRRHTMFAERLSAHFAAAAQREEPVAPPRFHFWARRALQAAAFRLRRDPAVDPEVRLADLAAAHAALAHQPVDTFTAAFNDVEMAVEAESVDLHAARADELTQIAADRAVIAISDTTWSSEQVAALLTAKGSTIPFRRVYASADLGTTKRDGDIFADVAAREGIDLRKTAHFGDDPRADVQAPNEAGVGTTAHLPRPRAHVVKRKLDGAAHAATPRVGAAARMPKATDVRSFSEAVMGPICAELCLRLYMHLALIEQRQSVSVLFCARGGLVMRHVFEKFLEKTCLPLRSPRHDLMISRLVAARAALAAGGESALDEISREFAKASLPETIAALGGADVDAAGAPSIPFDRSAFQTWLASDAAAGFHAALADQNALFSRHLTPLAGDAERLVLVDTGLYGSTHRLLEDAYPDFRWLSLMIARANYKNLPTPHFPRTIGLLSERDAYLRSRPKSVVLRYWHLIEDFFEPDLASVRRFDSDADGAVRSNLEQPGWRDQVAAGEKLAGALAYLDRLTPEQIWRIPEEAEGAWRRLWRMIVFPSARDAAILDAGERSRDFGRDDAVSAISARAGGVGATLRAIKQARWKEGSIAAHAGPLRVVPQLGVEALYALRNLRKVLKR